MIIKFKIRLIPLLRLKRLNLNLSNTQSKKKRSSKKLFMLLRQLPRLSMKKSMKIRALLLLKKSQKSQSAKMTLQLLLWRLKNQWLRRLPKTTSRRRSTVTSMKMSKMRVRLSSLQLMTNQSSIKKNKKMMHRKLSTKLMRVNLKQLKTKQSKIKRKTMPLKPLSTQLIRVRLSLQLPMTRSSKKQKTMARLVPLKTKKSDYQLEK